MENTIKDLTGLSVVQSNGRDTLVYTYDEVFASGPRMGELAAQTQQGHIKVVDPALKKIVDELKLYIEDNLLNPTV